MIKELLQGLPSLKHLRQSARLNLISNNPECTFRLPARVKKVELQLLTSHMWYRSHGLKKFWRQYLPALKFHNDSVSYVVRRVAAETPAEAAKVPILISLYDELGVFAKVNCNGVRLKEILDRVVASTGATPVPAEEMPASPLP